MTKTELHSMAIGYGYDARDMFLDKPAACKKPCTCCWLPVNPAFMSEAMSMLVKYIRGEDPE